MAISMLDPFVKVIMKKHFSRVWTIDLPVTPWLPPPLDLEPVRSQFMEISIIFLLFKVTMKKTFPSGIEPSSYPFHAPCSHHSVTSARVERHRLFLLLHSFWMAKWKEAFHPNEPSTLHLEDHCLYHSATSRCLEQLSWFGLVDPFL